MAKKQDIVNPLGERSFYFPSLDGLRFFAFFVVFLHHALPNPENPYGFANFFLTLLKKNGWVGVDLFFVLSGFLITSLLLKERSQFGKFSLKNFWIRRALRIWPLYYLALINGFLLTPIIYTNFFNENVYTAQRLYELTHQLPLYLTFLGNWSVVLYSYSSFFNISHLWTISVEEQFYLLWPIILLFCKKPSRIIIIGSLIVLISLLVRFILSLLGVGHPGIYVNTLARIDILCFGSIIAVLHHHQNELPKILRLSKKYTKHFLNLPLQLLSLIILCYILYRISLFNPYTIRNGVFGYLVTGGFMAYYLISALNTNSKFAKFLSIKPFVWLGKISYGLYVWHILALDLSLRILQPLDLTYFKPHLGFILTILISTFSYYLFESKFLKLKSKFTTIKSRPV